MSTPSICTLLVCPVTKQNLVPLSRSKAKLVYEALAKGELRSIDGHSINGKESEVTFLCTENNRHIYCNFKGTPILLESKQIDFQIGSDSGICTQRGETLSITPNLG